MKYVLRCMTASDHEVKVSVTCRTSGGLEKCIRELLRHGIRIQKAPGGPAVVYPPSAILKIEVEKEKGYGAV